MSEPNAVPAEPFAQRFCRELHRRTGGRVGALEVRQRGREVVVSCTVPSYHVKQLVILAALTAVAPHEGYDVVLVVRVQPVLPAAGGDGACEGPRPLRLTAERGAPTP